MSSPLRLIGSQYVEKLRLAADARSAFRLVGLWRSHPSRSATSRSGDRAPTTIRLRPLGGERVLLRPHTTDYDVLLETFVGRFHLEPAGLAPQTIFDLGANIGLTMAHYAVLFPHARIVGVELDAGNVAICRENIAPYGECCTVLSGAVWTEDGAVTYGRQVGNEWGFAVGGGDGQNQVSASAITMDSLFERSGWPWVDFVKMDIEGAERQVLRDHADWAAKVGRIGVEVHAPYTVEQCERDLQNLGFETARLVHHFAGVVGDRTGSLRK